MFSKRMLLWSPIPWVVRGLLAAAFLGVVAAGSDLTRDVGAWAERAASTFIVFIAIHFEFILRRTRRQDRWRRDGCCEHCGYYLDRAERCPECGKRQDPDQP